MPSVDDMTTSTVTSEDLAPSPAGRVLRQLGLDTQYILLGFPLGLVTVVLTMTGFFLGLGLTVVWIGLPIVTATVMLARGFATLERTRIAAVLGRRMPHPFYKRATRPGFWRRILTPLADAQSWLDLLHGMFRFIPSTFAFAFAVNVARSARTCPMVSNVVRPYGDAHRVWRASIGRSRCTTK